MLMSLYTHITTRYVPAYDCQRRRGWSTAARQPVAADLLLRQSFLWNTGRTSAGMLLRTCSLHTKHELSAAAFEYNVRTKASLSPHCVTRSSATAEIAHVSGHYTVEGHSGSLISVSLTARVPLTSYQ